MVANFYLLGAPKCGTSTLHQYLSRHPQVAMAHPKEPHFIACEFHQGEQFYRETYFSHWRGEQVLGDASTANLFLPWTLPRIAQIAPQAKLAVILRCPVQRAFSEWWMHHRSGLDPDPFALAVEKALGRLATDPPWQRDDAEALWSQRRKALEQRSSFAFHPYLEPGYYIDHIEKVWRYFPKDRLLILWLDDLERDQASTLAALWSFLEIEPQPLSASPTREHRARGPVGERLNRWAVAMRLHRLLPKRVVWAARDALIALGDGPPSGDQATLDLLAAHYRSYNQRLAVALNRNLDGWR